MFADEVIVQVKSRPELWQSSNPYYRKRAVNDVIWKDIATQLNTDVTAIKKRWKSLKDQYRKELKKVHANNPSGLPDGIISTWKQFTSMAFMKHEILYGDKTRKFWSSNTASDSESQDSEDDFTEKIKVRQDLNEEGSSSEKAILPKKRRKEEYTDEETTIDSSKLSKVLTTVKEIRQMLESTSSVDVPKDDPDYMYLVSLLPSLKKLTDIQKLHFRGKVNDFFLDAIIQNEYSDDNKYFTHVKENDATNEN